MKCFENLTKNKFAVWSFLLLCLMILALPFAGCSKSPGLSSPSSVSSIPGTPYAQLAAAGGNLFSSKCFACHKDSSQGSKTHVVIGPEAQLGKYNTAQGLLEKISNTMPPNAPGSLSHQESLQVTAYLLTQNNFVSSTTIFNETELKNIVLPK
jgi:mono/diheme cytochrome c family protein